MVVTMWGGGGTQTLLDEFFFSFMHLQAVGMQKFRDFS